VYQDAKYLVSRTTRLERVDAASAQRRIQRCYLVAAPPHAAPQFLPTRPPKS
jgi:hypothetical protein